MPVFAVKTMFLWLLVPCKASAAFLLGKSSALSCSLYFNKLSLASHDKVHIHLRTAVLRHNKDPQSGVPLYDGRSRLPLTPGTKSEIPEAAPPSLQSLDRHGQRTPGASTGRPVRAPTASNKMLQLRRMDQVRQLFQITTARKGAMANEP